MKRAIFLIVAVSCLAAIPAAGQTLATVGAGGIFPAGTTFNGVPLNGLQSGYGFEIDPAGSAIGQFCSVLLGVNALGGQQNIVVVGKASGGTRTAANMVTVSGTCTIDMGDGSAPLLGVPFTVAVTTDSSGQGTIGLTLGLNTLPAAAVNQGSMTIQ